ncbi:HAMP domain-containing histidine kinase [Ktedonobacteria bacterium brp13]|nr:HAMP domain-containing histidine kinase [Ktedonobacteria bacterium brp13]
MWHSLRFRLVVMFMLVVLVAVGTVALLASQATVNDLHIYTQAEGDQQLISTMLNAYTQHESQAALQKLAEQLARSSHRRIVLVDHQRRVLADSEGKLIGQVLPPGPDGLITSTSLPSGALSINPHPPATSTPSQTGSAITTINSPVDPSSPGSTPGSIPLYISTDSVSQPSVTGPGQESITFMQGRFAATAHSPETTFIDSVNRSLWLAVLLAGLVALLLALIFAHTILRPLHTLKVVARKMEQGDLSQRVFIKSKGEVGALAHAFNAMADSLSRSERLRRNLVSDVAHELRNPLMNIRGYLELLQDQVLEPTPETLASLYEETSLLNRLVADLQDLSLAEAGQLHLVQKPVNLAAVARQAVQIVQPHLVQKNLTLHVHLPSNLPHVAADQERIAQVLRNLLSNAIRHTPEQGKIRLTASRDESMLRISVRDSGVGIAPEHLPYLFERFYRADASRSRATGGSGLGLAVARQVVQAHGGQITVESQPGQGSCFTFTLPIAPSRARLTIPQKALVSSL